MLNSIEQKNRLVQNEDKFILKSAHWRRSSSTGLRLNKQGAPWLVVVGWLEQKQTSQHQHPQLMAPWPRPQNHRRQVIIELSVLAKLSPITVLSGFPPGFVIVAHTQSPNQDHLRRVSFFAVPSAGPADKSPIWFREPDSRMIRQKRARIKVEKSKQMEEDPLVGDHGSVMTGFLRRISLITAIIVTRPPAYWADLTFCHSALRLPL